MHCLFTRWYLGVEGEHPPRTGGSSCPLLTVTGHSYACVCSKVPEMTWPSVYESVKRKNCRAVCSNTELPKETRSWPNLYQNPEDPHA